MNVLINANVSKGGGMQVADSFIRELVNFTQHNFYVVLSPQLESYSKLLDEKLPEHIRLMMNNHKETLWDVITGRNKFLDTVVADNQIVVVFSIFGPVRWIPKVLHISGFAVPHIIYSESPFWSLLSPYKRCRQKTKEMLRKYFFDRTSDVYVTENYDVSSKLYKLFPNKKIYTVTNYYNQVFDFPDKWDRSIVLPKFDGVTMLTISADYPHKNLRVIPKVCAHLKNKYPLFKFRFVVTVANNQIGNMDGLEDVVLCIGKVKINQCPYLYQQADFMFLPTLLECFSASYPEAMVMKKPILTSNLEFAVSLCGDAAVYFEPTDIESISESIYNLASDTELQNSLVKYGCERLKCYDNYKERAEKYIQIIEYETNNPRPEVRQNNS